ncbi:MAG: restriction endonuclease, partial [Chloroflexota bacterium]|nr:restriction endonuclease [Chloroflexota bacterium]
MFDFRQIESGEDFELLCEDLLRAMGYTIEAPVSRGPDLGRDIIVSKTVTDEMGFTESYRYLIECKHYARSGKSVREEDIGSPIARMGTHNCNRYILITSTVPSEKVRIQLSTIPNAVPGYKATVWAKNDLVRFLEQHPDVWQRHVGLTLITGTPVWLLASEVGTWLQAMGYALSGKQLRDDDQVEMVAEMDRGTFRQRLLIRCLDGEADVVRVGALADAVRGQGFSEGWAIADLRVASPVRALAEENAALRVFNLAEFMRLTFGPYFDALTKLVEESHIPECYVDLSCCKIVTDAEGREVRRERSAVIDDYIDDWLKERSRLHISILGEFGTGKTWFCRHYAYHRLARYLADPVHERLPLLVTLRDFTKATTAQQLINDALLEKYKLPLVGSAFEVFERMNRQGKLLLILDGFDEMARKVDYQTVVDNFWELAGVVVAGSKVLLTSRTEYFRYAQESEKVLRGE